MATSRWKPLAQLTVGWALMMVGVLMMLESGMPTGEHPPSRTWQAVQAVAGLGLVVVGTVLRRQATRLDRRQDPPAWPRV